jgi:SWI/SNF-related matrix-associated actin-dependent regulator 1 of chromatin subfamily A
MFDVKRIEGRRFHPGVKFWSVPASLRAWKKLESLGFTMKEYGGMPRYVRWLAEGCPVGHGMESPLDLFPYQQQGVMRLLTRDRMVLADDPGLGKTWQAIEWARFKRHRKLVVAPKVVLGQWKEAIYARYRSGRFGQEVPSIRLRAPSWGVGEWNIVNYEFLPKLERVSGDFDLIVDEVHLCTNTKAIRTKHVLKLAEASTRTLLLSGTPPSKPVRLWPLFLMCGERSAKEFFPFAIRYCGAERNDFGWDFSGATNLSELRDELQHFMLRRTKAEVLHDLPPLMNTTLKIDAETGTVSQRRAIQDADSEIMDLLSRGHSLTSGDGIGAVQRLRVLTSKQKIPATVEFIQAAGAQKIVVFCYFRETMDLLTEALASHKDMHDVTIGLIHGDTPDSVREETKRAFVETAKAWVLIIQSGVGGTGLDGLQVASTGIIHDLPWTKDELDQITSRLHRQGQKDSVNMVTMVSTSQIEERLVQAQLEGKELHEVIYG